MRELHRFGLLRSLYWDGSKLATTMRAACGPQAVRLRCNKPLRGLCNSAGWCVPHGCSAAVAAMSDAARRNAGRNCATACRCVTAEVAKVTQIDAIASSAVMIGTEIELVLRSMPPCR